MHPDSQNSDSLNLPNELIDTFPPCKSEYKRKEELRKELAVTVNLNLLKLESLKVPQTFLRFESPSVSFIHQHQTK